MSLNQFAKSKAEAKAKLDAMQGSSTLLARFVEVVAQSEELDRDLKTLRAHLETRAPDVKIGVRIMAVMLGCAVLQERLLNMQIVAMQDEE